MLVFRGSDAIREGVFTPDGSDIVFRMDTPDSNRDIFLLPLQGERKPVPLLIGIDDDKQPRVSPDSKWLAYVSNAVGSGGGVCSCAQGRRCALSRLGRRRW